MVASGGKLASLLNTEVVKSSLVSRKVWKKTLGDLHAISPFTHSGAEWLPLISSQQRELSSTVVAGRCLEEQAEKTGSRKRLHSAVPTLPWTVSRPTRSSPRSFPPVHPGPSLPSPHHQGASWCLASSVSRPEVDAVSQLEEPFQRDHRNGQMPESCRHGEGRGSATRGLKWSAWGEHRPTDRHRDQAAPWSHHQKESEAWESRLTWSRRHRGLVPKLEVKHWTPPSRHRVDCVFEWGGVVLLGGQSGASSSMMCQN